MRWWKSLPRNPRHFSVAFGPYAWEIFMVITWL
jgi:hypothetical protein